MGRSSVVTIAALGLAVLAISSSAVLVAWADASPVALAFWRTAGGSLLLSPAALRSETVPSRSDRTGILVAGLALAAHFATWLASLELTSVAASTTLVSTVPLIVAGATALGLGSAGVNDGGGRVGAATWLLILSAVTGAAIITLGDAAFGDTALGDTTLGDTTGSGRSGRDTLIGNGLAVVGAFTAAVYLIIGARLRSHLSTSAYAARTYGVAAVALLGLALAAGIDLTGFDRTTWLAIGAMILGPQLAGHTLLNLLLKRLGPVSVSLSLLAEPIGASALAWLLLAQLPPSAVWIGGPLVLAAVASHILRTADDHRVERPVKPPNRG